MDNLISLIRERIQDRKKEPEMIEPDPPPRYDEVFQKGLAAIDMWAWTPLAKREEVEEEIGPKETNEGADFLCITGYRMERNKYECSKCGKLMIDEHGNRISAFSSFGMVESTHPKILKVQFGQYQADKEYAICAECFLESLGIVP